MKLCLVQNRYGTRSIKGSYILESLMNLKKRTKSTPTFWLNNNTQTMDYSFMSFKSPSTFSASKRLPIRSNSKHTDIHFLLGDFAALSSVHLYCIVCVQSRCQVSHWARLASSAWLGGDKDAKLAQLQHQQMWATPFVSFWRFVEGAGPSLWTENS